MPQVLHPLLQIPAEHKLLIHVDECLCLIDWPKEIVVNLLLQFGSSCRSASSCTSPRNFGSCSQDAWRLELSTCLALSAAAAAAEQQQQQNEQHLHQQEQQNELPELHPHASLQQHHQQRKRSRQKQPRQQRSVLQQLLQQLDDAGEAHTSDESSSRVSKQQQQLQQQQQIAKRKALLRAAATAASETGLECLYTWKPFHVAADKSPAVAAACSCCNAYTRRRLRRPYLQQQEGATAAAAAAAAHKHVAATVPADDVCGAATATTGTEAASTAVYSPGLPVANCPEAGPAAEAAAASAGAGAAAAAAPSTAGSEQDNCSCQHYFGAILEARSSNTLRLSLVAAEPRPCSVAAAVAAAPPPPPTATPVVEAAHESSSTVPTNASLKSPPPAAATAAATATPLATSAAGAPAAAPAAAAVAAPRIAAECLLRADAALRCLGEDLLQILTARRQLLPLCLRAVVLRAVPPATPAATAADPSAPAAADATASGDSAEAAEPAQDAAKAATGSKRRSSVRRKRDAAAAEDYLEGLIPINSNASSSSSGSSSSRKWVWVVEVHLCLITKSCGSPCYVPPLVSECRAKAAQWLFGRMLGQASLLPAAATVAAAEEEEDGAAIPRHFFVSPSFIYSLVSQRRALHAQQQQHPSSSSKPSTSFAGVELLSPLGLRCQLRPYQQRAVLFALFREWRAFLTTSSSNNNNNSSSNSSSRNMANEYDFEDLGLQQQQRMRTLQKQQQMKQQVNLMWHKVLLPSAAAVWVNHTTGQVALCSQTAGAAAPANAVPATEAATAAAVAASAPATAAAPAVALFPPQSAAAAAAAAESEACVGFDVPGGLLCDSMGLGKSVEVIALILANPRPHSAAAAASAATAATTATAATAPTAPAAEKGAIYCWGDEMPPDSLICCICAADSLGPMCLNGGRRWAPRPAGRAIRKQQQEKQPQRLQQQQQERECSLLSVVQCYCCLAFSHVFCVAQYLGAAVSLPFICPFCCAEQQDAAACSSSCSSSSCSSKATSSVSTSSSASTASSSSTAATATAGSSSSSKLTRSRGTLLVCPAAIVDQWKREVSVHSGPPLKVAVYPGLKAARASLATTVATLARAEEKAFTLSRGPTSSGRRTSRRPAASARAAAAAASAVPAGEGASVEGPRSLSVPPAAVTAALGAPPDGPHVLLPQLLDYDIVIVPFEALQQEVWFAPPFSLSSSASNGSSSNNNSRMALRGTKRYRKLFSPILGILWWRIVIDEAQLAGGFSGAARLCHSIEAVHRWCVSGTPLLDELSGEGPLGPLGPHRGTPQAPRGSLLPRELAGLLAALRLSTDCLHHGSPALLQRAFQGLSLPLPQSTLEDDHSSSSSSSPSSSISEARVGPRWGLTGFALNAAVDLLTPLMWRTEMNEVSEELGVPPPIVHDIWVELGPVERFFYQRQQRAVAQRVLRLCSRQQQQQQQQEGGRRGGARGRNKAEAIVVEAAAAAAAADEKARVAAALSSQMAAMLLVLRQAANHPQLGALGLSSRRSNSNSSSNNTNAAGTRKTDGLEGVGRYMSMDEVLCRLLGDARVELEEALRAYCAEINGIAGLSLLQGRPARAALLYLHVLELSRRSLGGAELRGALAHYLGAPEETVGPLILAPSLLQPLIVAGPHIDKLQQIHAAFNLHQTLSGGPPKPSSSSSRSVNSGDQEGVVLLEVRGAAAAASTQPPATPAAAATAAPAPAAETRAAKDGLEAVSSSTPEEKPASGASTEAKAAAAAALQTEAKPEAAGASSSRAQVESVSEAAAAATAASWDLFQRLRSEYASKAVGELVRSREVFRLRFSETEKQRNERVLACAGKGGAADRAPGGPSSSKHSQGVAADKSVPAHGEGSPLEMEGAPLEGNSPPHPKDPHLNTAERSLDEGPPTALHQLLQAEKWRRRMGGGRWFVPLAGLEEERSRALAARVREELFNLRSSSGSSSRDDCWGSPLGGGGLRRKFHLGGVSSCRGLVAVLEGALDELDSKREELIRTLESLDHGGNPSAQLQAAFGSCPRCNELFQADLLQLQQQQQRNRTGSQVNNIYLPQQQQQQQQQQQLGSAASPRKRRKKGRAEERLPGSLCFHCVAAQQITQMQYFLYNRVSKNLDAVTGDPSNHNIEGYHHFGDSELLRCLQLLCSFTRRDNGGGGVLWGHLAAAAEIHLKEFECLKRELSAAGAYLLGSRGVLSAFDELRMSVARFFLKTTNDSSCIPVALDAAPPADAIAAAADSPAAAPAAPAATAPVAVEAETAAAASQPEMPAAAATVAAPIQPEAAAAAAAAAAATAASWSAEASLRQELLQQRGGSRNRSVMFSRDRIAVCFTRHQYLKGLKDKQDSKIKHHAAAASAALADPAAAAVADGASGAAGGGAAAASAPEASPAAPNAGLGSRAPEAIERASRAAAAALYRQQQQQQHEQAQCEQRQDPGDGQQQNPQAAVKSEGEKQQQQAELQQQQQPQHQQMQQQKQQQQQDEEEPQRCPICLQGIQAGDCVVVLPCGHSICFSCLQKLQQKQQKQQKQQQQQQRQQQQKGPLLRCAICRHGFSPSGAALVTSAAAAASESAPTDMQQQKQQQQQQQQQPAPSDDSRTPSSEREMRNAEVKLFSLFKVSPLQYILLQHILIV
ncbi:LOW QUALITY PROTEIN: helicase, putative [Eimeria mitis]|uniref:Helicase, putative n=1 Tax=Eimeria mitis TaxID=44415 RepID=U6KM14_9EIME|nr:LOW QUALITY PROTEIN: helicase, putative [Eimeria mitis]CDJ36498.1 helicase, putative [Eimeria mitis]